ncbi:hypothetical protein ACTFR8_23560 [Bacillus cereus group sp. MYBK15-3]|uniref:hypothetical protein n=1 Tax=unclassified Bacillus cereus group TaxID=2750818 RepID=UPI003F79043F
MGESKGMFGLLVTAVILLLFMGSMGYNFYQLAVGTSEDATDGAEVVSATVVGKEEVENEVTESSYVAMLTVPVIMPVYTNSTADGVSDCYITVLVDGKEYRILVDKDTYNKVNKGDTLEVMKNLDVVWLQGNGVPITEFKR